MPESRCRAPAARSGTPLRTAASISSTSAQLANSTAGSPRSPAAPRPAPPHNGPGSCTAPRPACGWISPAPARHPDARYPDRARSADRPRGRRRRLHPADRRPAVHQRCYRRLPPAEGFSLTRRAWLSAMSGRPECSGNWMARARSSREASSVRCSAMSSGSRAWIRACRAQRCPVRGSGGGSRPRPCRAGRR
jgi:hypothetical protein